LDAVKAKLQPLAGLSSSAPQQQSRSTSALQPPQQQQQEQAQQQQQQQQQHTPGEPMGVASTVDQVLAAIQHLQQLAGVANIAPGDSSAQVSSKLLLLAHEVAKAHAKLHHVAATVDRPEQQALWRSQLAEYRLQEFEDQLEVNYLQLAKWQKRKGGLCMWCCVCARACTSSPLLEAACFEWFDERCCVDLQLTCTHVLARLLVHARLLRMPGDDVC
jgi:hypothetical protein